MAETDTKPTLTLSPERAFFILMKAREFDEKVETSDPDSGSNAADDLAVDVLEDTPDDPTQAELIAAVNARNDDEQLDLVAMIWIGRGDFTLADWDEARASAADIGRARMPRYVTGIPMVSDYLDETLAQLGYSLEDYVDEH